MIGQNICFQMYSIGLRVHDYKLYEFPYRLNIRNKFLSLLIFRIDCQRTSQITVPLILKIILFVI